MVKTQSSLDSFFGTGKKVKKQKTLTSFFNKENSTNSNDDDSVALNEAKPTNDATSKAIRHRAILDDSDEDDNDGDGDEKADGPLKETKHVDEENSTLAGGRSDVEEEKKIAPDKNTTEATAEKEDVPDSPEPTKSVFTLCVQADKLAKLAKVDTNEKLETISSPVKYEDLVTVFEKVESISGRLEIQGLVTMLFRRILRDTPTDLYPAVYLASNSIAPAYECLELGIGDSILQKAIGEAYGTKACMYRLTSASF